MTFFLSSFLSVVVGAGLMAALLELNTIGVIRNYACAVLVFALAVAVLSVSFLKILPAICLTTVGIFKILFLQFQ